MNHDREKLADRILKMLALAAGTSFEAEAATARRLADELMAKHNIDLPSGKADRNALVTQNYTPHFKGMLWEFNLGTAAAYICGCMIYAVGPKDAIHTLVFVGTVANLEAAIYILNKLHEQRIAEWLHYKGSGGSDKFHKFCFGYAQAVLDKVHVLIRQMPALRDERQTAKLWYEERHKVGDGLRMGRASSSAGLEAGGSASLHRGELGGGGRQRLIR